MKMSGRMIHRIDGIVYFRRDCSKKVCEICGDSFIPAGGQQKYCEKHSQYARKMWNEKRATRDER
jgi:hypothetical protein